jgi:hypothetical protein
MRQYENSWTDFRDILYCGDDLKYVGLFKIFLNRTKVTDSDVVPRNGFRGKQGEVG